MESDLPLLPIELQKEIFNRGVRTGFIVSSGLHSEIDTSVCWYAIRRKEFNQWVESLPVGSQWKGEVMFVQGSIAHPIVKFFTFITQNEHVEVNNGSEINVISSKSCALDAIMGIVGVDISCMIFDRITTETIVSKRRGYNEGYYKKMVEAASYFMKYEKAMAAFLVVSFNVYCSDDKSLLMLVT